MKQYIDVVNHILNNGIEKKDRTGVGTISCFGYQTRFNMNDGFPLLTTKKLHFKSIAYELLWFLKGSTNVKFLNDNKVTIWNEWADQNGDLGPIYGKQWTNWKGINQIQEVVNTLKTNPNSRRMIVSAWNVSDLHKMRLPPCHMTQQYYCINDKLSLQLYIRSNDIGLGMPYNIASYALLLHMMAQQTNKIPHELIYTIGDLHIYSNHVDQLKEQIKRDVKQLPTIKLSPNVKSIFDYTYEDIKIIGYDPHPNIKMEVAI